MATIDNMALMVVPNPENIEYSDAHTPKQLLPEFYDAFLSDSAKERKPGPIGRWFPLEKTPGIISLLAGKPNEALFPFKSFSFTVSDSKQPTSVSLTGPDLAEGLQYGLTEGMPRLIDWLVGLQERAHGRKRSEGWGLAVGNGSQDMIWKGIYAIINPGDPVLIETPVYAGVIPIFRSLHCELVEVATDECGVCSSDLRSILENWPKGKPKPKAFYTVPYGCNPTGMTTSIERRREVLQLAREYNFLILEDDPNYYLYFGEAERPPSYFKLELETPELGRVVRFDSFSSILSAGMRMGFVSGPQPITKVINFHTNVANLQCSYFVQAITLALVEKWGHAGFFAYTKSISEFYREKRDTFEKALQIHLAGLAEWKTPEAGLFFWIKLLIHVDAGEEGDSKELILTKACENRVLALPGTVFFPDGRDTAYVRVAFSLSNEQVDEALRRLREVLLNVRDGR